MKRLVAFGCSHTWGDSLSEEQNGLLNKNIPPHPQSWPYVLGNLLGRETINISYPGEGNKAISHKIFNFDFKSNDIVVPLWTHVGRHSVISKINSSKVDNYSRYNYWMIERGDKITESYFKNFYTFDDDAYQTLSFIQSVNFTLNSKVQKILNSFATLEILKVVKKYSTNLSIYQTPFVEGYYKYGKGLDQRHLGSKAHEKFAHGVYEILVKDTPSPNLF